MNHRTVVPVLAAAALGLAACSEGDDAEPLSQAEIASDDDGVVNEEEPEGNQVPVEVRTELVDPEGSVIGGATVTDEDNGVVVHIDVSGMTEGFHPVALYEAGVCEPESASPTDPALVGDFLSAGPVLGLGEAVEGVPPAGALPPLLITERTVGELSSLTGGTDLDALLAGDGTTLIIHEGVPSIADLPLYGEEGSRIACGVISD